MGDLIPFLGDGLLTTDGEYHRRSRKIMLPAFHRERLPVDARHGRRGGARRRRWRPGDALDLYAWTRGLALRMAMKALFGVDPIAAGARANGHEFERGLGYYGATTSCRSCAARERPGRR